jgi:hypothetical protein
MHCILTRIGVVSTIRKGDGGESTRETRPDHTITMDIGVRLVVDRRFNQNNEYSHHGTDGTNRRDHSDFTKSLQNQRRDQQDTADDAGPCVTVQFAGL